MENDKPKWLGKGKCELCLRCIHLCPKNAIEYKTDTVNKKRYKEMLKYIE